jgi:hypothetical protein
MAVINPQIIPSNTFDALAEGSVINFYNQLDMSIVPSDVIKGSYHYTRSSAYNASNPVNSNSYTTLNLSQGGNNVVNLENSFITTEVYVKANFQKAIQQLNFDGTSRSGFDQIWFIGWKSSIEAIQRYDILVNSQNVYTQNFVGEESFMIYQTLTDLVKHSTPYTYTSYENVSKLNPCMCGVYVLLKGQSFKNTDPKEELKELVFRIPIKIPICNFQILKDIKYLHSWMGRWELRLFFSPQNLVILPINPERALKWWESYISDPCMKVPESFYAWDGEKMNMRYSFNGKEYSPNDIAHDFKSYPELQGWFLDDVYTNADYRWRGGEKFVQFGDPITFARDFDKNLPKWDTTTLSLEKMECYDVELISASFQIRSDVNMAIKSRYLSDRPLTYPVSVLTFSRFTGLPTMGDKVSANQSVDFTMVLDQCLNNVNTMFILPFRSHYEHTVCEQPYVENLQIQMGEYGVYPMTPINTFCESNRRLTYMMFNNYIQDCLNYNSSRLFSMPKQLSYQFCPNTFLYRSDANDGKPQNHIEKVGVPTFNGLCNKQDISNFFIAMPFSTENDFQGGLSSPVNNINIKVMGTFKPPKRMIFSTPWVCAFLTDGEIMIRPDPASDNAKVIYSIRSLSE